MSILYRVTLLNSFGKATSSTESPYGYFTHTSELRTVPCRVEQLSKFDHRLAASQFFVDSMYNILLVSSLVKVKIIRLIQFYSRRKCILKVWNRKRLHTNLDRKASKISSVNIHIFHRNKDFTKSILDLWYVLSGKA